MTGKPELYYIISAEFSGERNQIYLKLYNPVTGEIKRHYDRTGYLPYIYTNWSISDVKRTFRQDSVKAEIVTKYNALREENVKYTRVFGKDPLEITGDNKNSVKMRIEKLGGFIWEGKIKSVQSYIYDKGIQVGMPYYFNEKFGLIPYTDEKSEEIVDSILELFKDEIEERKQALKDWARFFEYIAPYSKRAAVDIEVLNEKNRVPDPNIADQPVIAVAFITSDGRKIVLVLEQPNKPFNPEGLSDCEIILFNNETRLLRVLFNLMRDYPFIITFNGDEFDLPYLKKRGTNLGIAPIEIPISVKRKATYITTGVHIDLYKFFSIGAIQTYAFQQKYKIVSLDEISKALLNSEKIHHDKKLMSDLSYAELINYNLRDGELTLQLTSFNKDIVMNLIWAISRISRLTMEDASRLKVGAWIRSFLFNEHRKRGYIIPRPEEILAVKGQTTTKALIKGKKYKGAIVVEPVSGIHFKVVVVDFQSLYPSIIKFHNIGYVTVNCKHPECFDNKVEGTTHHICKKVQAMESVLVGALKDLRVIVYKGKPKEKNSDGSYKYSEDLRAWYSVIEQTDKVIMNASYGVFGFDGFDLYCPPVAESIAAIARFDTTNVIDQSKALDITVLYGDTDSTFLKQPTKEQLDALIKWALDNLNMDLAVDKKYRYVCLSNRKKNYFGVFENGEVDVKGLTGKKKHTPKIFKETFNQIKKILADVNKEEDFPIAKQQIKKTIKKTYNTIKRREWTNLSDLSFTMGLNKDIEGYIKTLPQHVQAAKQLRDAGYDIKNGETIEFVKVMKRKESARQKRVLDKLEDAKELLTKKNQMLAEKRKKQIVYKSENVDCFKTEGDFERKKSPSSKPIQLVKNEEVDINKYIEFLRSVCIQILEALDMDWKEDIEGVTELFSFHT